MWVWDRWRRGGQDTAASPGRRWHHPLSLSLWHIFTVSLCLHLVCTLSIYVGRIQSRSLLQHHFPLPSPVMIMGYIPSSRHLTLCLSFTLFVSLSPNCMSAVSSKHGVLKLLIIIPWHEMMGRLNGGHIAAKVLQHTKWAELTEPRSRRDRQPQDGSTMENGSWVGGSTCL